MRVCVCVCGGGGGGGGNTGGVGDIHDAVSCKTNRSQLRSKLKPIKKGRNTHYYS